MKSSSKVMQGQAPLELFYDGECPLCLREVNMLRGLDRHGRILFTDIAGAEFRPPAGIDFATLMARIHARRGATWFEGVEVFRQLYTAVGFGALVAITRAPGVKQLLDLGYTLFAKNRLRLTGRCESGVCALEETAR